MREIKFRLFCKHDKQMYIFEPRWGNFGDGGGWVGGVLLKDYEKNGRTFAPSNQMQLEPEGCEWMQFAGLLDRNEVEIYEGDIIQWWNKITKPQVVEATNGGWNPFIDDCQTDGSWHYIVIGNIYENPELLIGKD